MAKEGEIADIVSLDQLAWMTKQANSGLGKGTPLDSRGMTHNAGRDKNGRVVKPGGGKADTPPAPNKAAQAIMKWRRSGGRRSDLPQSSDTKNAARKDLGRAKMRKDNVVRPAVNLPGTAEYNREARRRQRQNLHASKKYLSKSINETFGSRLNKALGL
jgi:hypothetical protein